jgi:hypothetical protein
MLGDMKHSTAPDKHSSSYARLILAIYKSRLIVMYFVVIITFLLSERKLRRLTGLPCVIGITTGKSPAPERQLSLRRAWCWKRNVPQDFDRTNGSITLSSSSEGFHGCQRGPLVLFGYQLQLIDDIFAKNSRRLDSICPSALDCSHRNSSYGW